MSEFVSPDRVEWRQVGYLRIHDAGFEYMLTLPRALAEWDVWEYWERERVHSMRDHLQPGMTLFDVGTEQGWCNLVYASFVGPGNMVLIEPTPEFWPNIMHTWRRNYDVDPKAFYAGLASDTTDDAITVFDRWPWPVSDGPLIDRNKYQYIHEHSDNIQQLRLDDFVARSGVVPDALTMDIEGAELVALRGAVDTLEQHHPLVWVSVHPDMAQRDYGVAPNELFDFMSDIGYRAEHLATDHEEHWFFS